MIRRWYWLKMIWYVVKGDIYRGDRDVGLCHGIRWINEYEWYGGHGSVMENRLSRVYGHRRAHYHGYFWPQSLLGNLTRVLVCLRFAFALSNPDD